MAHSSRGVGRSMSRPSSFTAAQDPFGGAAIKEAEVFPGTPHEGGAAGGGALQGRLSTRVKFSYALPRAVLSGVQATAGTYLVTQQYEHTRQVAYVTIVAFASLLLGSYIQAIVAHFGDGLRTTYGRRRPTLFVLAWLCAIAAFMQLHYWPSSGDPIRCPLPRFHLPLFSTSRAPPHPLCPWFGCPAATNCERGAEAPFGFGLSPAAEYTDSGRRRGYVGDTMVLNTQVLHGVIYRPQHLCRDCQDAALRARHRDDRA
jgi:hypothetical protein